MLTSPTPAFGRKRAGVALVAGIKAQLEEERW